VEPPDGPGTVESGVEAENEGLADARPRPLSDGTRDGLLDNPKSVNQQLAAAKVMVTPLDQLRSASAIGRRGKLALVKSMTTSSP
jgi:hypothetical protein